MMQSIKRVALVMAAGAAAWSNPVWARDAGDPVFPVDMNDKARAEILYQSWQRDAVFDVAGTEFDETFEADVYLLRIHTDVGEYAYLDFDLGAIEPDGGDMGFYGGVGLRYLAYDAEPWRVSAFAQVHYAPEFSGDNNEVELDADLIDADAGLLLSCMIDVGDQLAITPYVGPALSVINVDGDVEGPAGGDTSFDAEEDNVLGAVAGLALQFPGMNGFRMEAQIFDEVSISAAASIAF